MPPVVEAAELGGGPGGGYTAAGSYGTYPWLRLVDA